MTDWFLGAGLVLLFVGLFPFGPYQLSLILARQLGTVSRPLGIAEPVEAPSCAICMSVYNEAEVIRRKVEEVLALRAAHGPLDILIYVDGATDDTTQILRAYQDEVTLVVNDERRGKTHGMNCLVTMTRASIIVFTDANVRIDIGALGALRKYFSDPEVGCVSGQLSYVNESVSATASVGASYWRFDEWTKELETATGSIMGAGGALFAVRGSLVGHRPADDLIDDLYVPLHMLCDGHRVISAPDVRAYQIHTTRATDEFRRKIRIACQCMRVHFALWPRLKTLSPWNLYKYLGRRLLRWVGGYLFLAAGLCFAIAMCSVLGFWVSLAGMLTSAAIIVLGYWMGLPMIGKLANVALAFTGNAIGVALALRGESFATWNLARSARTPRRQGRH